jgi:hypothetical protein
MFLKKLSKFQAVASTPDIVQNNQDIPTGEMEIFYKTEAEFLPEGKTFADLTEDELNALRAKYRFSPMRPSSYQNITGLGTMAE